MNREYLESLLVPKDKTQEWVSRMVVNRGDKYYGNLKKEYSKEYECFYNMMCRTKKNGLITDFEYSPCGFIDFLLYVGHIPKDIICPSIGRFDHSKGYVKGNFSWEEKIDNISEVSKRPERREWSREAIKDVHKVCPNHIKSHLLTEHIKSIIEQGTIELDPLMVEFEINYANIRRAIRRFCEKQNLSVKFPYGKRKAVIC